MPTRPLRIGEPGAERFGTRGPRPCNAVCVRERIDTDRLWMRPLGLDDVDLLVELDSDPEVMRFLTGRPSSRVEIEESIRTGLGRRWIAHDRSSGEFVGWFTLRETIETEFVLGYRLRRRWWGMGLATEGTRALIDLAFTERNATRVTAQTMAVNQRSRRVMEQCGMRLVRTLHLEFDDPLPGVEHGETEYELTMDQWRHTLERRSRPS